MNIESKNYIFVLGREVELCLEEIRAVLPRFFCDWRILSVADNCANINIVASREKVANLMNILAGTTKIYELNVCNTTIAKHVTKRFQIHLDNSTNLSKKIDFSLSSFVPEYNINGINKLGFGVKKESKFVGISTRFIELRDDKEASSAMIVGNKLIGKGFEFGLFKDNGKMCLGELIAVSDPNGWSLRDYGKPRGDKRSGMLPPKLARMMINLALGKGRGLIDDQCQSAENIEQVFEVDRKSTIVIDPFCGSGNVLIEALLEGFNVFGSDISAKAVDDTKVNIDWLKSNEKFQISDSSISSDVMQFDATSDEYIKYLEKIATKYQNLVFVGEPYLGEPKKFKPSENAIAGEYRKIYELYLAFFQNVAKFMNSDTGKNTIKSATFCIVFPLVEAVDGRKYSLLAKSVDEIKKIGYIVKQRSLLYGRDYQVVKREIALFTYINDNIDRN
ncbi:MAG: hypothetical protein WCO23_03660 [bacterium]